jgi:hypothetical protein
MMGDVRREVFVFRSDLPSERRRLFIFVCAVFLVVGFSVKALIYELGWVGGSSEQAIKPITPAETRNQPNIRESPPAFTEEDRMKAKSVVEAFLPLYVTHYSGEKEKRLAELERYTTPAFFELLKAEADEARPSGENVETQMKQIERVECSGEESLQCLAVMIVEEKGKETLLVEKVLAVFLTKDEENWLIREVESRGSFD